MKWSVIFVVLFGAFAAYSYHQKDLREAERAAAAQALEVAKAEAAAQAVAEFEKERLRRQHEQEVKAANSYRPAMGISTVIEPLMFSVLTPLKLDDPQDYVPAIEITRQRILDKRSRAEGAQLMVFDRAKAVMDYLDAMAEERTKTLESVVKARQAGASSMSRPKATPGAVDFFAQSVMTKWSDTLTRARPILGKLADQLRASEAEWNKQVDKNADVEPYDIPPLVPLLIPLEQVAAPAALGASKSAVPARPWRAQYYASYGLHPPVSAP